MLSDFRNEKEILCNKSFQNFIAVSCYPAVELIREYFASKICLKYEFQFIQGEDDITVKCVIYSLL